MTYPLRASSSDKNDTRKIYMAIREVIWSTMLLAHST